LKTGGCGAAPVPSRGGRGVAIHWVLTERHLSEPAESGPAQIGHRPCMTARTCEADQRPPRAARIPRTFSPSARSRSVTRPAARNSSSTGMTCLARAAAFATRSAVPRARSAAVRCRPRQPPRFLPLALPAASAAFGGERKPSRLPKRQYSVHCPPVIHRSVYTSGFRGRRHAISKTDAHAPGVVRTAHAIRNSATCRRKPSSLASLRWGRYTASRSCPSAGDVPKSIWTGAWVLSVDVRA